MEEVDNRIASDGDMIYNDLAKIQEQNMVIIGFLSRLYDIQMAMLTHFNLPRANEVYELHESGGNANPPLFIPEIREEDGTN